MVFLFNFYPNADKSQPKAYISVILKGFMSAHPRRLIASDSLEERVVMAKSSMVTSTIPKNPVYHGNRKAYMSTR
jgi:hypothetical protein